MSFSSLLKNLSLPQAQHKEDSFTPLLALLTSEAGTTQASRSKQREDKAVALTAFLFERGIQTKFYKMWISASFSLDGLAHQPLEIILPKTMRKCARNHELGLGVASGTSIKSKHNTLITWKYELKIAIHQEAWKCHGVTTRFWSSRQVAMRWDRSGWRQ